MPSGQELFQEELQMPEIYISAELKNRCPKLKLCCILTDVIVAKSGNDLLAEINRCTEQIQQTLILDGISKLPAIEASRKAYKACGKDPARYRLSAEALLRRVVFGKGIYQINNVVDQLNLVSIATGFSIGGYDVDKIQGDICFGIDRKSTRLNSSHW
jgi:DNA/RNA-binding domain of Phe-tRNA-synthetase-like protein